MTTINRQAHVLSMAVQIGRLNDQIAELTKQRDELAEGIRNLIPDDDLALQADGSLVPVTDTERPPSERGKTPPLADRVLAFMAQQVDREYRHGEVALAIGANPDSVRQTLIRLQTRGDIEKVGRGQWKLATERHDEDSS